MMIGSWFPSMVIAGVGSCGALWQYCHCHSGPSALSTLWQYCHNAPVDPTPAIRISETVHEVVVKGAPRERPLPEGGRATGPSVRFGRYAGRQRRLGSPTAPGSKAGTPPTP